MRRVRGVQAGLAIALIVGAVGLVGQADRAEASAAPSSAVTVTPPVGRDRPVLVIGDSLSHQAADEIVAAFASGGFTDVEVVVHGGTTIGWATDRIVERPSRPVVVLASGTYNEFGGWTADDDAEARRAVAVLEERACAVWVVPAPLSARDGVRTAMEGSAVHAAEWDLVADALPQIHVDDAVHHSLEGQRLYAELMVDSVRGRCEPLGADVVDRNRRYVASVHETFLRRSATDVELDRWGGRLSFGFPRIAFTHILATSDEWLHREIDAVYRRALGRPAEPAGRSYWAAHVRAGAPFAAAVAEVFASDERFARSGGTARGYVADLYRTLLHREPDPAGLRHWTGLLTAGTPRRVVAADLHMSLESRRDRVTTLYRSVLGRDPDRPGRDHWADALLVIDDVRVAAVLAASDEAIQRARG